MLNTEKPASISKANLPFFISWVVIFIWLFTYFCPFGKFYNESSILLQKAGNISPYFCVWFFSCILIALSLQAKNYIPRACFSMSACLFFAAVIAASNEPRVIIISFVCFSACLGHVFVSANFAFFIILSNQEKFYSMLIIILVLGSFMALKPFLNSTFITAVSFALLSVLLVCSYLYRKSDQIPRDTGTKPPLRAFSLMPVVFVVQVLNDVIAPAAMIRLTDLTARSQEVLFFYGILAGIAATFFLQRVLSLNICNMLNISLALSAVGFVLGFMNGTGQILIPVFFGMAYAAGIVNIYYLSGFLVGKYQSELFYRIGLVLSGTYYISSLFIIKKPMQTEFLPPGNVLAFASIMLVIVFFLFTPLLIKILYGEEQLGGTCRPDRIQNSSLEEQLREKKLTPAEIQVCKLLLEGYTLRQISSIISKSYSTVNTYYSSIYRKLGIQSKTELILQFRDYIGS